MPGRCDHLTLILKFNRYLLLLKRSRKWSKNGAKWSPRALWVTVFISGAGKAWTRFADRGMHPVGGLCCADDVGSSDRAGSRDPAFGCAAVLLRFIVAVDGCDRRELPRAPRRLDISASAKEETVLPRDQGCSIDDAEQWRQADNAGVSSESLGVRVPVRDEKRCRAVVTLPRRDSVHSRRGSVRTDFTPFCPSPAAKPVDPSSIVPHRCATGCSCFAASGAPSW